MIDVVTFGETMVSLRSAGPLTVPGTLTARIAGAESTWPSAWRGWATRSAGCRAWATTRTGRCYSEPCAASAATCQVSRWTPRDPRGLMIAAARTADTTAVTYEGLPTRAELDDLQLSEVVTLR